MRAPWSCDELDRMLPEIESRIAATEAVFSDIRPLPAMTIEEALT